MPQFHVLSGAISSGHVMIKGDEFNHICNVVRKKVGDELELFDENGVRYSVVITCVNSDAVICKILDSKKSEKGIDITLYQCLPKSSKMDLIVEKATELGIKNIVPVISKYVVSRPDQSGIKNKIERWKRKALAAAKQSGNSIVPDISEPLAIEDVLMAKDEALKIVAYEMGSEELSKLVSKDACSNIKILIGAEGGFSANEIQKAQENNWKSFRLKGNILRAETAPIVILSIVKYIMGEL